MTDSQFKQAIEINEKIAELSEAKNVLNKYNGIHLNYSYIFDGSRRACPVWINNPIESILSKHDKMMREDIDREIEQLREQIKML